MIINKIVLYYIAVLSWAAVTVQASIVLWFVFQATPILRQQLAARQIVLKRFTELKSFGILAWSIGIMLINVLFAIFDQTNPNQLIFTGYVYDILGGAAFCFVLTVTLLEVVSVLAVVFTMIAAPILLLCYIGETIWKHRPNLTIKWK